VANENQKNALDQQSAASADAVMLGARGASRRRFARAGAGATGVLMTLASQPGMACEVCRTPSGYQSVVKGASKTNANAVVSAKPNAAVVCEGWTPTRWYNSLDKYNKSYPSWRSVQFGSAFPCSDSTIRYASAETLLSLCRGYGSNGVTINQSSTLAMWLVAAYLNAEFGKSSFLKTPMLVAIWSEFQSKKTYTPTAGVTPWTYADIILYLSGTMD